MPTQDANEKCLLHNNLLFFRVSFLFFCSLDETESTTEELDLMPDAKVIWCESEEMIADILTKALQGIQFEKLVLKMGMCPVEDQDT